MLKIKDGRRHIGKYGLKEGSIVIKITNKMLVKIYYINICDKEDIVYT